MTDRLENYFPGLEGVYVNESGMSFVDGQQGKLYYCGYSIEDLAANCNFEHVAFLLLYKRLPTRGELETFKEDLIRERYLIRT